LLFPNGLMVTCMAFSVATMLFRASRAVKRVVIIL
jgi:hypothetical protein